MCSRGTCKEAVLSRQQVANHEARPRGCRAQGHFLPHTRGKYQCRKQYQALLHIKDDPEKTCQECDCICLSSSHLRACARPSKHAESSQLRFRTGSAWLGLWIWSQWCHAGVLQSWFWHGFGFFFLCPALWFCCYF